MDTEQSEKSEQNPCDGIIEISFLVPEIRQTVHGGNQKKIDNPADKEKPQGKKPDGSRNGFAVVKPMGARKTKDPKDVAD